MGNPILFIILATIALASALGMLLNRNAVHSALFLILNMVTLAVLYLVLNAPFIAMVQITVYAGAIMVLFLFVIMLLGAERTSGPIRPGWQMYLTLLLTAVLLATFGAVLLGADGEGTAVAPTLDASPTAIGLTLFESYVFPFEVTSILLLAAMVGVVVLRMRRKG
ncbi:MAG: NADH-quinone oxidoreductase subunit J [Chloroflexota bacterium]